MQIVTADSVTGLHVEFDGGEIARVRAEPDPHPGRQARGARSASPLPTYTWATCRSDDSLLVQVDPALILPLEFPVEFGREATPLEVCTAAAAMPGIHSAIETSPSPAPPPVVFCMAPLRWAWLGGVSPLPSRPRPPPQRPSGLPRYPSQRPVSPAAGASPLAPRPGRARPAPVAFRSPTALHADPASPRFPAPPTTRNPQPGEFCETSVGRAGAMPGERVGRIVARVAGGGPETYTVCFPLATFKEPPEEISAEHLRRARVYHFPKSVVRERPCPLPCAPGDESAPSSDFRR